jgi:hypothetical protein
MILVQNILKFYVLLTVHLDILCNENQLLHCLSLIYFVNQPLHVSGMFIAHHQEVYTVYVHRGGELSAINT